MNKIAIQCNDVWFSYFHQKKSHCYKREKTHFIFNGVSFSVLANNIVCIIGANGSGKSTLAKLIVGMLTPQRGSIALYSSHIGYLAQGMKFSPHTLLSVRDVVSMGLMKKNVFRFSHQNKMNVDKVMDLCGIADYADVSISKISEGQTQRAFIARMIVADANLIVLDEPTTGLDISASKNFCKLLKKIKEYRTIVLNTHDISLVSEVANKVLCLTKSSEDLGHKVFLEYIQEHLSHIPIEHLHKI